MTTHSHPPAGRGRRGGAATVSEQQLVARLQALSAEHAATPDEEFRASTRARLVAMAAVRPPAGAAGRRPPARAGVLRRLVASDARPSPWRTRLTAGLAGAALTVTALGGLLAAAQGARPGDLLYDLKRGGEQTRLAMAGDSRGLTLLGFATTRLDELGDLVGVQPDADAVVGPPPSGGEAGLAAGPDVDLVLATLQTMDAQTAEGTAALTTRAVQESDQAALTTLTGWAGDQQAGLDDVAPQVPTGAQGAVTASRELVGRVATRGTELEAALGCAAGPAVAGADDLGPLPVACDDTAAPPTAEPSDPAAPGTTSSGPTAAPGGTPAPSSTPVPTAPGSAGGTQRAPGAPAASGLPSAPAATAGPGLPVPTLPSLSPPALPVPGLPGAPSWTTSTPAAPSVVLPLPSVPGVQVCAPPLVTVGC